MTSENQELALPEWHQFSSKINELNLPITASTLHGIVCGYICLNASQSGENYLRACLQQATNKSQHDTTTTLFSIFTISQQQINHIDFGFELMLPDDDSPLSERAYHFSNWCRGFIEGINKAGFEESILSEEETIDAVQHIEEFANLDYENLSVSEEDEKALMEVIEYTRMAVLRIHTALMNDNNDSQQKHH